ncbi:MAG: RNA 2',3'-cyclic phosphodiesterase [Caulobacteraceae bacterium]
MIRLFAALHVTDEIADGLERRQHGLESAAWRPREAFHITLRFFGDVAENVGADIESALVPVTGAPLTLGLTGVGAFGEGRDIHAVWAGVDEQAPLTQLHNRCEAAARKAGLAADTRAYRPHVTLAYLKRPDPAEVAEWIQDNNLLKSPPFTVSSFGLYSSHVTRDGSRYRLERRYPLTA